MNEDHTSKSFKIGGDDQENDAAMQNELQELKIDKLSQRVMLLTILIPCMIGVILIISYLDIKDRVKHTQSTGTIGVQKLSKDLDSKFSSLSLEQAKLKEVHDKKLPALEKSAAFLQTRLKKVQASIKNLEASNIKQAELTQAVNNQLNTRLGKLMEHEHSELDAFLVADQELNTKTETLSNQVGEMADAYGGFSEKLTELEKALADLSATQISKEELDLGLKLKEIGFRQEMLDVTGAMEKKIDTLKKQVDQLKKQQVATPAPQPKPAPTETKPETTQTETEQAPASIEEQNIE
ncbi:MAG: hypothetical protein ABFS43_19190 [Thermodesulfobacteriota bacterium]